LQARLSDEPASSLKEKFLKNLWFFK